jgi:plasmid stabilization system protein ParE
MLSPTWIASGRFCTSNRLTWRVPSPRRLLKELRFIRHPQLGRPIAGREEYRQLVLQVLGGNYVFQYRYDGARVVILRVFHAKEAR